MQSTPRTKTSKYVTQVVPACLSSSGLLDSAIDMLQKASCPKEPITIGKLAAVHVLGGTLSLSKGRGLFPRPAPGPGPAPAPATVSSAHLLPTFCQPSAHLLPTFCPPSAHLSAPSVSNACTAGGSVCAFQSQLSNWSCQCCHVLVLSADHSRASTSIGD